MNTILTLQRRNIFRNYFGSGRFDFRSLDRHMLADIGAPSGIIEQARTASPVIDPTLILMASRLP